MHRGWLAAGVLFGVVLAGVAPAHAWSARTRMRMADDALKLMPRSLREVLREHREELVRGAVEPMTAEGSPPHRPPWDDGSLPASIAGRSRAVSEAVIGQRPFSEVARRFGELAHYVADAGFPPNAGGTGDEWRYRHFTDLVDNRLDRLRFVFYGHGETNLERGNPEAFVDTVVQLARAQDVDLARAYAAAGDPPEPSAFDDRSVPFAIASLAYSRTTTSIVRAWIDAWRRSGGDMTRIPYWKGSPDPMDDEGERLP